MVDHIVDASEPRGRVDIRVGVGRRRWSVETKGRIVAESYAPGAVVSEVVRRHDMSPQHLFGWRKTARAGLLTLPADEVPMFVPVVRAARDDGVAAAAANRSEAISMEIAGVVVRAERGVDLGWLRDVLRTVRRRHDRGCGRGEGPGGDEARRLP
jgi:transposase